MKPEKEAAQFGKDPESFPCGQANSIGTRSDAAPVVFKEWKPDQFIALTVIRLLGRCAPITASIFTASIPDLLTQEMESTRGPLMPMRFVPIRWNA